MILTYESIFFPTDAHSPQNEDPTHVLIQCLHYSTARREVAHVLEKLKLPLDVPTVTGINFFILKHTKDKLARAPIQNINRLKTSNSCFSRLVNASLIHLERKHLRL